MNYREEIDRVLAPLMSAKCAMLNLPYYPNPGDGMIWLGMEQFMAKHGVECIYRASAETFVYRPLGEDVTICFVGGGNFGDLWCSDEGQPVCKVARMYPKNRIVVFPQSVFYENEERMLQDAEVLAQHPDLYICARDKKSYTLLKKHFTMNHILLTPDMALYLELDLPQMERTNRTLFLKRKDKEAVDYSRVDIGNAEVSDWPMMEWSWDVSTQYSEECKMRHRMMRLIVRFCGERGIVRMYKLVARRFLREISDAQVTYRTRWQYVLSELWYMHSQRSKNSTNVNVWMDWFAYRFFMPIQIAYAMEFIGQYDRVITTRLHSGVLAMLMGKEVEFVDNSYGKISALYDAWLEEEKNVTFIKNCNI